MKLRFLANAALNFCASFAVGWLSFYTEVSSLLFFSFVYAILAVICLSVFWSIDNE